MLTVSKRRKGCPFGKLSAAGISVQFGRTSPLVHGSGENALAMLELLIAAKEQAEGQRVDALGCQSLENCE